MPQQIEVPGMGIVEFPDGMGDDAISAAIKKNMGPTHDTAADVAKSGGIGGLKGFLSGVVNPVGGAVSTGLNLGLKAAGSSASIPSPAEQTQGTIESLTGKFYEPKTKPGRYAETIGSFAGNPLSWVGPGSATLKAGGVALGGAGSEAAGQATQGSPYEGLARVAGALTGGVAAGKTLGPSTPRAAVPNAPELFASADRGYEAARNSGLELHPKGVASFAAKVEQDLAGPDHGFTGGKYGDAPKTFDRLQQLQNSPTGASITASNLDTLRKSLGRIARETNEGKPTPDAAAASIALENLKGYTENLPQNHIVAGDAASYVSNIKQANGDFAAASRVRGFDARLTKAENATDRQVAGSLDSQIKSKAGSMLDNPKNLRGLNQAEKDQLQLINSGGPVSNTLRQLGRGGAGVIPIMGQLAAAPFVASATGGVGLAAQAALAAGLYGARKGSEAITKSRAKALAEMLAKRSPEYEQRLNALPPSDNAPNKAAIARALLGSL